LPIVELKETPMPSPFPGMDPYLEGSEWTSFHAELAAEIARQLTPLLAPRYVARAQKRFVVVRPETEEGVAVTATALYPDDAIADADPRGVTMRGGSSAASAVLPAPLELLTVMPESVPLVSVEIQDAAERRLVTAIEILSPTNKRGDGREEYLEKRQRLLLSTAHLLEIDLQREGQRVPMRQPLPGHPYFVLLSRSDRRPLTHVWPIALDQPLPPVPVPLRAGDADVTLNLQQALTSVYDMLRFDLTADYTRPPEVSLRPQQAAWAREHLGIPRPAR
jgi:hypothetical protein